MNRVKEIGVMFLKHLVAEIEYIDIEEGNKKIEKIEKIEKMEKMEKPSKRGCGCGGSKKVKPLDDKIEREKENLHKSLFN
jgi:hypothetical protein